MTDVSIARPGMLRALLNAVRMYLGLTLFGVSCFVWSILALPLYYVLPQRAGMRLGRRTISAGFRLYLNALTWMGACRFDLSALDALKEQGPVIIAPNHPSLIDAVMVLSRLPGLECIMKSKIMDNPCLGAGARLARYIRNDDPHSMIRQAVSELRGGNQLLLFPEGTRSDGHPIGRLCGSTGLIAKQAHVPVQTVLIELDSPFLTKGWSPAHVPQTPITYRVRLGRRFDPPENAQGFAVQLDAYFTHALADATLPRPIIMTHG